MDLQNKDWVFDARIIELNKQEVIDYFLARQAYAIDKYLMQLKAENDIVYYPETPKSTIWHHSPLGDETQQESMSYRVTNSISNQISDNFSSLIYIRVKYAK